MQGERHEDGLQLLSRYRGALMGFSALLVLFYHCWIPLVPGHRVLGGLEAALKHVSFFGVDIFFFLSGMGLTYAIRKESLRRFYARRIARLAPPFLFMAVIRALSEGWTPAQFLSRISGVSFCMEKIYTFLWFVPAAMMLYLLFPLYHRALTRARSETAFTVSAIGLWLIASLLLRQALREDLWLFLNRVPVFLLGALAGRLEQNKRTVDARAPELLILLVLGYLLFRLGMRGQCSLFPLFFCSVPTAMMAVSISLLLARALDAMACRGRALGGLSHVMTGLLSFVGGFTLELYCVQEKLYEVIYSALEGRVSYTVINAVSIPVCLAAGWALHAAIALAGRTVCGRFPKKA